MGWHEIYLGGGHKIRDHNCGKHTGCNKLYCSCSEFKVTLLEEES